MKFEKPGPKPKKAKIPNRVRLHDFKKPDPESVCANCGMHSESLSCRHIEVAWWKCRYGKGTGTKVDDRLTALLCETCDKMLSPAISKDSSENSQMVRELMWLRAIIKTHLLK
jgi:hypothetical protein